MKSLSAQLGLKFYFYMMLFLGGITVQAVTTRFDKWRETLKGILGVNQKEPRCFSYQLKKEMMAVDPSCSLCNQRISSIDDAALDHVKQYWMGGKTVPENARLTHRYCNCARPRKEAIN